MPKQNLWLTRTFEKPNADYHLICFPYAGGDVDTYRNWQEMIGEQFDVLAIQMPGRGVRYGEKAIGNMAQLVAELSEAICKIAEKPIIFFGHGFGAYPLFEIANHLIRNNLVNVALCVFSAAIPPHLIELDPELDKSSDFDLLTFGAGWEILPERLEQQPSLVEFFLPVFRDDVKLACNYQYEPGKLLPCEVILMAANDDQMAPEDYVYGWSEVVETRYGYEFIVFGGSNHFFIEGQEETVISFIKQAFTGDEIDEDSYDEYMEDNESNTWN